MKVVTVHRGARDGYHVAGGLAEAGLLEALVTDLYWPADRAWAQRLELAASTHLTKSLRARYAALVPSRAVASRAVSGLSSLALSKIPGVPFSWKRDAIRWCDGSLGKTAGEIATSRQAALLAYSYYAYSAFSHYQGANPKILFQLHPHPASVRDILQRERELQPDCASSLDQEWELALPSEDFQRLANEPAMANYCIVASQFTKKTLTQTGVPADRVAVVPYGIDLATFSMPQRNRPAERPLRLLFVGTLCQRKGIKYLLQAVDMLPSGSVELTVCGRAVDDLSLFKQTRTPVRLFPSISPEGLREAYRNADVFVFPSLAEGFGHVLLEAMASGLPILATDRTAAPDLIRHGEEGFLVEPGSAIDLATHIEKLLENPARVRSMGRAARQRAEYFTWGRFRQRVSEIVSNVLRGATEPTCLHF